MNNKNNNRPDPSWKASEIEIPNASFEIAPIANQKPARNSTTPVHATWNDLLPGMYQNPQAPWAGIIFSNPLSEFIGVQNKERGILGLIYVLWNNGDLHIFIDMQRNNTPLMFSPSFIEKWDSPAAINIGPKIGHVIIQVSMGPGKACLRASIPAKVCNRQR